METQLVLERIGLGYKWISEEVGEDKEWRRMVRDMIQLEEERKWREGILTKSKLGLFSKKRMVLDGE